MSLLNDALRRASEADRRTRSAAGTPLVPIQSLSRPRHGIWAILLLGCLVVLSLGAAFWFLKLAAKPPIQSPPPDLVQIPRTPNLNPPPRVQPQVQPQITNVPPPVPAVTRIKVSTQLVVRPNPSVQISSPDNAPAGSTAAGPMPELKLQSIIHLSDRRQAMINGEWVEPGGEVTGVRVVEIRRTEVMVEWRGMTQALAFREP